MIQVIHADDPRVFDYSLFPEQHPGNMVYIQQNMSRFGENLTATGMAFMEQHRQIYQQIDHDEIARKARNVMRAVRDLFRPDVIVPLETIQELQEAQLKMQRYMMAQPDLRRLYQSNKAEGFYGSYVDVEPGRIEEQHLDYRKVMTGAVIDTADGWVARQYYDELFDGDTELAPDERVAIRRTWDAIQIAIAQGQDPSNPFGGEIGV